MGRLGVAFTAIFFLVPAASAVGVPPPPVQHHYPPLSLVKDVLTSTANNDFVNNHSAYLAASDWHIRKLSRCSDDAKAPYLVCADYRDGRQALTALRQQWSRSAVQPVANSNAHGSCFLLTVRPSEASTLLSSPSTFYLTNAGPVIPTVKLASGLLDYGPSVDPVSDQNDGSTPLRVTYGEQMKLGGVRGLTVRLSPGVLPIGDSSAKVFLRDWRTGLMSDETDVHAASFWSDPDAPHDIDGHHVAGHAAGMTRVREWNKAAAVIHDLAAEQGRSPGETCQWQRLKVHQVDHDLLLVEGVDHLLHSENASTTKRACFMGLLSQLAAKPEVLRVAPLLSAQHHNAVANAIVQSSTITQTPLQDAGLDGTGEVIQIVDSGLDETSCFFADSDGKQVEHGHAFDGVRLDDAGNTTAALNDPYFPYDTSRRKVIQYIELFKVADEDEGEAGNEDEDTFTYFSDYDEVPYGYPVSSTYSTNPTTTSLSEIYPDGSYCAGVLDDLDFSFSYDEDLSYSYPSTSSSSPSSPPSSSQSTFISSTLSFTGGFDQDTIGGHGTWTAGCAAGSIPYDSPYLTQDCHSSEVPGCAGECFAESDIKAMLGNELFDIDTFCPAFDCDVGGVAYSFTDCLGDDTIETLAKHSGVAPGAKIAMFDASFEGFAFIYPEITGNLLWSATDGTGAKIHSNSWGYPTRCQLSELEFVYETFMYENPENILMFSAGNDGGYKDIPTYEGCTIGSPALGKNILSVGASSSGSSRATDTGEDGRLFYDALGLTDYSAEGYPYICELPLLGTPSASFEPGGIDTMSWFSSYGPTLDGRIKPEIVAPGDQVFSADSDGSTEHSCKLGAGAGTSASCPLVAGAAALIRQYFVDSSFYANDVGIRGLCSGDYRSSFTCEALSPSSATVKAMLINSANLMGGSTEPDNFRGFGRVHIEAGTPMNGDGPLAILVADSSTTSIMANEQHTKLLMVDADAGLELRVTLCWLDPPATAVSAVQLQHDLDLVVISPSGATHTMWASGVADTANVIERVIVPAATVESGMWTITVSAEGILTDEQPYSLVVTGGIVA